MRTAEMHARMGRSLSRCRWVSWVAALAAGFSVMQAQAVETFSIPYAGTATIPIDCFIQPSECGLRTFAWQSTVTLQTVSAIDGVYRFDSFPPNNPSSRPSSSWSSTRRPPRRSDSRFRRRCCCARTK